MINRGRQQENQENQEQFSFSCSDFIFAFFYLIYFIVVNLFPVIAQIKALYYLCNYDKYLNNPNAFKRKENHIALILNGYIVGYLIVYLFYHLCKFVGRNFDNQESFFKRHLAQTIAGLIIFKIWYEIGYYGSKWIWDNDYTLSSEYFIKQFFGHILMTICTLGLFIPFRIILLIIIYFHDKNPWKRHIAQTIGCLIVFKIWYELFHYGIRWVYDIKYISDKNSLPITNNNNIKQVGLCEFITKQFFGNIFLTIGTVGFYIPFRIIQLIVENWNNKNPWVKHGVQTLAGLIIFKIWFELFHYGIVWVYHKKISNSPENDKTTTTQVIVGYLFLIIATGGFYIPYLVVEQVWKYWNDENPWKRHIAQTIGGIIIFKIWYELFHYGFMWVYDYELTSKSNVEKTQVIKIPENETSKIADPVQPNYQAIQENIIVDLEANTVKIKYKTPVKIMMFIFGHIFLTIATLGLYILYRPVELIILNFNSKNPYKRHISQTLAGLIVLKIWYEILSYGSKWVYKKNPETSQYYETYKQVLGYIFMTIGTFGLFIPGHIIFLVVKYWDDENPWKRHIAQTVGLLVVFKLWYELFVIAHKLAYKEAYYKSASFPNGVYRNRSILEKIFGRILYTIATLGFFIIFMCCEYIFWMKYNLSKPEYTKEYKIGVIQCSVITFGLYGSFKLLKSISALARLTGLILLSLYNVLVYALIFNYAVIPYLETMYYVYVIVAMCIVSYPMFVLIGILSFTESIRFILNALLTLTILGWWKSKHILDNISQVFRYIGIKVHNGFSIMSTSIATSFNNTYANFVNNTYPRVFLNEPVKTPETLGYFEPTQYQPTIFNLEPVRSFNLKMIDRIESEDAIQKMELDNTIYTFRCVIAKMNCNYSDGINVYPGIKNLFWAHRFDVLPQNKANRLVVNGLNMETLRNTLFKEIRDNPQSEISDFDITRKVFIDYVTKLEKMLDDVFANKFHLYNRFIEQNIQDDQVQNDQVQNEQNVQDC